MSDAQCRKREKLLDFLWFANEVLCPSQVAKRAKYKTKERKLNKVDTASIKFWLKSHRPLTLTDLTTKICSAVTATATKKLETISAMMS